MIKKRKLLWIGIICLWILLMASACRKQEEPLEEDPVIEDDKIPKEDEANEGEQNQNDDMNQNDEDTDEATIDNGQLIGSVESGRYTNDFFSLDFVIPESYQVLSTEGLDAMVDAYDHEDFFHLLMVTKYPLDSQRGLNPSLSITAEKVQESDPLLYISALKETLEESILSISFGETIVEENGVKKVYTFVSEIDSGMIKINQSYRLEFVAPYMLVYTVTYSETEGLELLDVIN